jgi:hypothetical protein
VAAVAVFGVAGQQIEGVGQYGHRGQQGVDGGLGLAGHIQDDARSERRADAAAQDGQGCSTPPFGAHQLGDAGKRAVADGKSCLRGHIACGDAGTSGGDDEPDEGGGLAQCVLDGFLLVWNRKQGNRFEPTGAQSPGDSGAGKILLQSFGTGVAYCNYRRAVTLWGHLFDCTKWNAITDLMRK